MLEHVKLALRVSSDAYDPEVQDLIESAQMELIQVGVSPSFITDDIEEMDPLIKRFIVTYAKANFGFDNSDADRLRDSYVMLKQHLSLAGDYIVKVD